MSEPLELKKLIEAYFDAQRAWLVVSDREDLNSGLSPEWYAYETAENAVLFFPCNTLDDVRTKAAFVLLDPNALDSVKNCIHTVGDECSHVLDLFLHSILGPTALGKTEGQ